MKRYWAVGALFLLAMTSPAQKLNPVHWTLSAEPATARPGSTVLLRFTAQMDPGWHLYSLSTPKGGPVPTTIQLAPSPAVKNSTIFQPKAERRFDPNFNLDTETFEKQADFLFRTELSETVPAGRTEVAAQARYQACNDKLCLPPRRISAATGIEIDPQAPAAAPPIPSGYTEFKPGTQSASTGAAVPVKKSTPSGEGGAGFALIAFGFGLAAIFTPCVFPMIPITVSFFLNKGSGSRGQSVLDAVVFSLGIVVLFSGLGLIATAILGPFGIVQLGSNIWVNLFIALVFLLFGLSLLGAFEITIPSSVLTGLNRASGRGGILGTLLMGLTFSLTAFACVGPFVGTLLAASVQGGGFRPALGMVAFSAGLASPFFLLALFPSYLKRLPKSGGWMERVKIVMGFIILAAMFKYLSSIDQVLQWNVLTRERFLAIWIVLFSLAGLYLLGLLRLAGSKPDEMVGLPRLLIGAALLVFAISLIPGMFGARLGELDAYIPQASGGGSVMGASGSTESAAWMKNQYREALAKARQENKLVLVSFTGYACTNCHWMKANIFNRSEIASALKDLVLVELYTDGTDEASRQNQGIQERKFGTVAIPFYAILDPDEKVIAVSEGLTRDSRKFLAFLRSGSNAATAVGG